MNTLAPSIHREVMAVSDHIPMLDTARFEHMQRIAQIMALCAMIPEHLRGKGDEATQGSVANCFMIVNQAVRWGMDPFAVAQATHSIKGKLGYEGKLVAAVLDAQLGVRLQYAWSGNIGTDDRKIRVFATIPGETVEREITGSVKDWKTDNSMWKSQPDMQLAYRGARAWARLHAPAVLLGVYTADELEDMKENIRANNARDITPPSPPPAPSLTPPKAPPVPVTQEVREMVANSPQAPLPRMIDDVPPDPEAFIAKAKERMMSAEDGEGLSEIWEHEIEPYLSTMFPPDVDALQGIYRMQEQRVAP